MKTLIQSIEISSVKEAEEILKAAGTEDLFEKAHFDGEMHPNGKLVWRSSANNGKGDWRVAKKKKDNNEEKKNKGEKTILEKSKNLFSLFVKSDKYFKGHLYHVDGTEVTRDSIEKRISESKNNMTVILDVLGTKGKDKIERSDMKDDKIAGSYGIVKNNNTGMFELLKFEDD